MSTTLTKKLRIGEIANLIRKGETITSERKKHLANKWDIHTQLKYSFFAGDIPAIRKIKVIMENLQATKVCRNDKI